MLLLFADMLLFKEALHFVKNGPWHFLTNVAKWLQLLWRNCIHALTNGAPSACWWHHCSRKLAIGFWLSREKFNLEQQPIAPLGWVLSSYVGFASEAQIDAISESQKLIYSNGSRMTVFNARYSDQSSYFVWQVGLLTSWLLTSWRFAKFDELVFAKSAFGEFAFDDLT